MLAWESLALPGQAGFPFSGFFDEPKSPAEVRERENKAKAVVPHRGPSHTNHPGHPSHSSECRL